jgi:hypothetical protein
MSKHPHKKTLSVLVDVISLYDLTGTLNGTIDYLEGVRMRLEATHPGCEYTLGIDLDSVEHNPFDVSSLVYRVFAKREETDEEYAARIKQEAQLKESQRQQYQMLKWPFTS